MSQLPQPQSLVIVKRDGRSEKFDARKTEAHLRTLSWGLDMTCLNLTQVLDSLPERFPAEPITAEAFLIFLAEAIATFSSRHPDYSLLAGRVYACYHHKRVPKVFSTWILSFDSATNPVFTEQLLTAVREHGDDIDAAIVHRRDFDFSYRALQIFERSYLLRDGRNIVERVQFLFMRLSLGIHGNSLGDALHTYELLSTRKLSFAPPALWNGGLANRHVASSFVFEPSAVEAADGIINFSALSGLWASGGDVGISAGDVPATSSALCDHPGLLPLLRVYDSLASYWSRSSRHGSASAAVYVPIWHADIRKVIISRTTYASSHYRYHHLLPALWIPDLFMRRLEADDTWSLFDPRHVQGLSGLYSKAFESAYVDYERRGLAVAAVRARALWETISDAIRETGTPFISYSDNVNARNNQMHLGLIKASSLCTEVAQFSSSSETSVCALASLCLPRYLRTDGIFNYTQLHRDTKFAIRSLDRLVDLANYPTTDAAVSAYRTRSIGLGVQGLADVFATLEKPYDSPVAHTVSRDISETIYHAALEASCDLAEEFGPYDSWQGSPAQQGVLQLDMWDGDVSGQYDFDSLRDRIRLCGLRNSVLTCQMPTASTAPLFDTSDGVNPYVSNVVHYRALGGRFTEVSRPLIKALQRRGLWNERVRTELLDSHGSVQTIPSLPDDLKEVFKTAFELDQRVLIDMASERSPFIDQSQSIGLFVIEPTPTTLMELQLHAWRAGLKTGAYYVHGKPSNTSTSCEIVRPTRKRTGSTFTTFS